MKKNFVLIAFILMCSSVNSASWIPMGAMSGGSDFVNNITSAPSGDLYASSWAVGIFKSTDGMNWSPSGLDGKRVSRIRVAPDGNIYALSKTTSESFIHRSTNNGASWADVYTGSFPLNYAGGGDIVFLSDGSMIAAFSVTVGPLIGNVSIFVFKSTTNGESWNQLHRYDVGFVGGMAVTADGKILMGTSLAGVICSSNGGASFTNLTSFPAIFIQTIVRAPDNTIYVSDAYGLNKSTDNGQTFTATAKTPFAPVRAVAVNSDGHVFLSMDDRNCYRSTNMGDSWENINYGLPSNTIIYSFATVHEKVYGGTNNSGAYAFTPLTGVDPNQTAIASEFKLAQNYPNPFNPSTIIKYDLPAASKVSLKIFDINGREVAELFNGLKERGSHFAEWNAAGFPSGTYFYRLSAAGFTQTKTMILVK